MPGKLAWFPLYVKDLMMSRKVSKMNNEEFGIYIKLLCHQWLDGYLPKDMDELANMCGIVVGAMMTAWDHVGPCFKEYKDGYLNLFLEDVRLEQETKSEKASRAGRIGAEAMWAKKREEDARKATVERLPSEGNNIRAEKSREDQSKAEEGSGDVSEYKKSSNPLSPILTDDVWQVGYWEQYTEKGVNVDSEIFQILQWAKSKDVTRNNWKATITNWLNKALDKATPPGTKSAHVPAEFTPSREVSDGERKEQVQAIGDVIKEHWPEKETPDE